MPLSPTRDLLQPVERLTPADGHYFFGYYDLPAVNADGVHLCHRVPFRDRLPAAEDVAELGILREGAFLPFAETTAWNFQQGSMLQWHPTTDDTVIFNRRTGTGYAGVIRHLPTGTEQMLPAPVANVSPDGRYALSVNFPRMFDFRPGYGYAGIPDSHLHELAPEDDGIFLLDLASGECSLVVSLAALHAALPAGQPGQRLLINHLTFNTDGTRFVLLARINAGGGAQGWGTAVFTAGRTGEELSLLLPYGYASHYHWRDPRRVTFHCTPPGKAMGLYALTDRSAEAIPIDPAFFLRDGHNSYSPDRRWLLYDSYPIDGYRYLYLYALDAGRGLTLGGFASDPAIDGDIRCDLHPRWTPDGTALTFDSIHEGFRGVYRMDVRSAMEKIIRTTH